MRKRTALTLMELVLVLTILAVLGGLVIAVLPSVTKRTHLAKCSDTIAQLNTSWMRAYALNVRYPDVYDSLLDDTGNSVYSDLTPALKGMLKASDLSQPEADAFRGVGITRVVDLAKVPTGGSATYDSAPLTPSAGRALAGGKVAELNLTEYMKGGNQLSLKRHLVRQPDGTMLENNAVKYIVFGLGANCSGVGTGKIIQEAPVHFGALDQINPTMVYQRYLIIFSLVPNPDGKTFTVNFEAAAGNDVTGPSSAEGHIRQFHDGSSKDG